jgi:hypothetical protein
MGPDVGTRLRVLVVLSAAAALLVGLAACAPRPIRAPLCEGIAYTGHALNLSSSAIDALETNELAERDDKLNFARVSLEQAQGRLEEARRSSDSYPAAVTGLAEAIQSAAGVIDAVSTSGPQDVETLRRSVNDANAIISAIGQPLAGCNVG